MWGAKETPPSSMLGFCTASCPNAKDPCPKVGAEATGRTGGDRRRCLSWLCRCASCALLLGLGSLTAKVGRQGATKTEETCLLSLSEFLVQSFPTLFDQVSHLGGHLPDLGHDIVGYCVERFLAHLKGGLCMGSLPSLRCVKQKVVNASMKAQKIDWPRNLLQTLVWRQTICADHQECRQHVLKSEKSRDMFCWTGFPRHPLQWRNKACQTAMAHLPGDDETVQDQGP